METVENVDECAICKSADNDTLIECEECKSVVCFDHSILCKVCNMVVCIKCHKDGICKTCMKGKLK